MVSAPIDIQRKNVIVRYEPGGPYLVPDDHIEEIVAAGRGTRVTSRGDALRALPDAKAPPIQPGDD
jgi:hypothetical protein